MQVDEEGDSRFSFEEYGFSLDQKIVMCSGTCELRKGTDLFVSAAQILSRKEKNRGSPLCMDRKIFGSDFGRMDL